MWKRLISLLKVLMTNYCVYDCKYCVNRRTNETHRATFTPEDVVVRIAGLTIFRQGTPVKADWDSLLASALRRDTVDIDIDLGAGGAELTLLASDFTEEYIKINAEYRT